MEQVRYMISDAANIVQLEQHVLRYWEDELQLDIPRNEMGHRYYTDENIKEFLKIKELKEKGYQLKAIRMYLKNEKQREQRNREKDRQILTITNARELGLESDAAAKTEPTAVEDPKIRMEQFQAVINNAKCRKALPAVLLLSACMLIPYGRGVQKYLGVFFFGIAPYAQLKSQLFPFAPLICILWMAAVVLMLFGLFILCPKKETFLCQFGKNTIGIYILHRLFKDFLIYGGFYELLSANGYLAVLEIMGVSLLLTFLFGTAFWADIIKKLSRVSVRKLYS